MPPALGGYVWEDVNSDGLQEPGEAAAARVRVDLLSADLLSADARVLATTRTGADGHYLFGALAPGRYQVRFLAPSGSLFTTRGADRTAAARDSDVGADGVSRSVTVHPGQTDMGIDAGLVPDPAPADPPTGPSPTTAVTAAPSTAEPPTAKLPTAAAGPTP